MGRHRDDSLWAISCFFNPGRYEQRLRNYRLFRERLPIPLLCVELSHDGTYELDKSDSDILVQICASSVMWQKERLLNIAVAALPAYCKTVAWLDNDVLFGRNDWHRETAAMLDRFNVLQLFSHFTDLPRDITVTACDSDRAVSAGPSFAFLYASGGRERELFDTMWGCGVENTAEGVRVRRVRSSGLAWAARREIIDRHGFYDACISGSGDRAIACAAYGRHETSIQSWIRNERQRQHYLNWARPFACAVNNKVSYVEGEIYHLWHGELRDRHYRERQQGMEPFGFDPFVDIAIDEKGCWRWNSDKAEMHEFVRRYFQLRNEDGNAKMSCLSALGRRTEFAEGHSG